MDTNSAEALAALADITERQLEWASKAEITVDSRLRTSSVDANLFAPIHPDTEKDFALGQGDELGTPNKPGKLASLISSAALAVNVFDAWRGRPAIPLCDVLGLNTQYRVHQFEAIHPTGLRGTPPHLDVELKAPHLPVVAIESKFTEPYRAVTNNFRPSYFSSRGIWEDLSRTRLLAVNIADRASEFVSLHVAQLIKHALGLTRSHGQDGFVLIYLWYRAPGPHGTRHQLEVERFWEQIGDDFSFRSLTYQELLGSVDDGPERWLEYVSGRYLLEN